MIYRYPVSGNAGEHKWIEIDTDSAEFQRRVAWISEMAGIGLPRVLTVVGAAPNVSGGNVSSGTNETYSGVLVWTHNNRESFAYEVRNVMTQVDDSDIQGPTSILASLNIELGLGMTPEAVQHMRYEPPSPPKPVDLAALDIAAAGSPLREELPGQPGKFSSRHLGKAIGDKWTGPSGAVYELRNIGGIFQYLAWVRQ
jgi:hypothetical protein